MTITSAKSHVRISAKIWIKSVHSVFTMLGGEPVESEETAER